MSRVCLVHWNREEGASRISNLHSLGYEASLVPVSVPTALRQLRDNPPDAVVIDLSRLPSSGRDLALAIRSYKATRNVPLVFAEGPRDKVERIKQLLSDAVYTNWDDIRGPLKQAIENPPSDPVIPKSRLEGYSGAPLTKKLGIKPGSTVVLVDAPPGFGKTLKQLSEGLTIRSEPSSEASLTIWFATTNTELQARISKMVPFARKGGLWIAWPKKSSNKSTDLSETVVRRTGLAAGIVDYKIVSIDSTWSALRWTQRRPKNQLSETATSRR